MPVTDLHAARQIIFDRFKAQWDILHAADVPVAWPNVPFDPQDSSDYDPASHIGWVAITVAPGESFQASISGNTRRWRTPGVVSVQIYTPAGTDDEVGLGIADDVATALRGVTDSGVVLTATTVSVVGTEGDFYQINAHTRFRFDTLQTP